MTNNAPPTTHRITQFYQWNKGNILELAPPFQRNPIWSQKSKSYLIDTILKGLPVPEIFIQVKTDKDGNTKYVVVDGQQRIRSILEYIDGEYELLESETTEYGGKEFKDLPDGTKTEFWDYPIVTRELKTANDDEVRSVFTRMNKYVFPLNPQERRHAIYRGYFMELVNQLTDDEYWVDNKIVSPSDVRRMLDSEFISELIIAMLHGAQTKKPEDIDGFYRKYDEEFEDRTDIKTEFSSTRNKIEEIMGDLRPTRWRNKVDFYSLFLAFHDLMKEYTIPSARYEQIRDRLCAFGAEVDSYRTKDTTSIQYVKEYADTIIAHTTEKSQREKRLQLVRKLIIPFLIARDPKRDFTEEERRIVWEMATDKMCLKCGEEVTWNNYHLDHRLSHNKGGKTELENSQIMHARCNESKSNK